MLPAVTEEELSELYAWVDSVPLSRPKKSIARDFSDAVLVAEIVHHYFPRMVELHNYSPASNSTQKMNNWTTLNTRVFKKLGFTLPKEAMEGAVYARPGEIEPILKLVRTKLAQYQAKHSQERAAHIPLLATESPNGINGIFSRGAEAEILPRTSQRYPIGGDGGAHHDGNGVTLVGKVLEYDDGNGDENNAGNHIGGTTIENIQSYGGAGASKTLATTAFKDESAVEVEDLRALNQVLEVKAAKLEQLLRLKDAKIAALTARLQGAGLLTPAPLRTTTAAADQFHEIEIGSV